MTFSRVSKRRRDWALSREEETWAKALRPACAWWTAGILKHLGKHRWARREKWWVCVLSEELRRPILLLSLLDSSTSVYACTIKIKPHSVLWTCSRHSITLETSFFNVCVWVWTCMFICVSTHEGLVFVCHGMHVEGRGQALVLDLIFQFVWGWVWFIARYIKLGDLCVSLEEIAWQMHAVGPGCTQVLGLPTPSS